MTTFETLGLGPVPVIFNPAPDASASRVSAGFTGTAIIRAGGDLAAPEQPKVPTPRKAPLPLGGDALMYTRENLTWLYHCSHGELGRLLVRKMAPLPIRIDGQILWFADECLNEQAQVQRTLERWRKSR